MKFTLFLSLISLFILIPGCNKNSGSDSIQVFQNSGENSEIVIATNTPQADVAFITTPNVSESTAVSTVPFSFPVTISQVRGAGQFNATIMSNSVNVSDYAVTFSGLTPLNPGVFRDNGSIALPFGEAGIVSVFLTYTEAGINAYASFEINIVLPNAPDLFISEYMEGSGDNKAVEIANFTGEPIDLSQYSLRKATNGASDFDPETFPLTGMLPNEAILIIRNIDMEPGISGVLDLSPFILVASNTPTSPLNFDGNDPIGLFKGGDLVDVLGVPGAGSSLYFGEDSGKVRLPPVVGPSDTLILEEWDVMPMDDFSGFGSHERF